MTQYQRQRCSTNRIAAHGLSPHVNSVQVPDKLQTPSSAATAAGIGVMPGIQDGGRRLLQLTFGACSDFLLHCHQARGRTAPGNLSDTPVRMMVCVEATP